MSCCVIVVTPFGDAERRKLQWIEWKVLDFWWRRIIGQEIEYNLENQIRIFRPALNPETKRSCHSHTSRRKENKKVGTHCKYSPQKGERPLGCSGRTTLRREQCDMLLKKPANQRFIARQQLRKYAIVDEAVFSPCRAEDSRPEPSRAEPSTNRCSRRIASPRVARQQL
jgi:hypothetical protein